MRLFACRADLFDWGRRALGVAARMPVETQREKINRLDLCSTREMPWQDQKKFINFKLIFIHSSLIVAYLHHKHTGRFQHVRWHGGQVKGQYVHGLIRRAADSFPAVSLATAPSKRSKQADTSWCTEPHVGGRRPYLGNIVPSSATTQYKTKLNKNK